MDPSVEAVLTARLEELDMQIDSEERQLKARLAPIYDERRALYRMLAIGKNGRAGHRTQAGPGRKSKSGIQAAERRRATVFAAMRELGATDSQHGVQAADIAARMGGDETPLTIGTLIGANRRHRPDGLLQGDKINGYWVNDAS